MRIRDYLPIQEVPIGAIILKDNGKPDYTLKERTRGCTRNHIHTNGANCYDRGTVVFFETVI